MLAKGVDTWDEPKTEEFLKEIDPLVTFRELLGSKPTRVSKKLIIPA